MLISKDWTGFNAGVFLIRICEWSINILSDAIAVPRLRPEVDIPYREQDALKWVLNQADNKKHRIYQPRHWWNQYPEYYSNMGERVMKGTINLHFPGMGGARPDSMGYWLDKIENHPEEVSIPFYNTSYPAEIEAYWSRIRSAAEMLHKTEDYKNELKEEHYDAFVSNGGKIPDSLGAAQHEVHEVIQEEAYDKQRLREVVLHLDKAVRDAKKDAADYLENKEKEEEKKRKEEEEKRNKEEEKKRKEEEEKKRVEENKKKKNEELARLKDATKSTNDSEADASDGTLANKDRLKDPAGGAGGVDPQSKDQETKQEADYEPTLAETAQKYREQKIAERKKELEEKARQERRNAGAEDGEEEEEEEDAP